MNQAEHFGAQLEAAGFSKYGQETMVSGVTGEEMPCDIYIGVVYYQRLRHMVSDKFQVGPPGRRAALRCAALGSGVGRGVAAGRAWGGGRGACAGPCPGPDSRGSPPSCSACPRPMPSHLAAGPPASPPSPWQVRSTGTVNQLTKQPIKGRKMGGGIRFGEMERDSLLAHGAAYLLHDRLHACSDYHTMDVCTKWAGARPGAGFRVGLGAGFRAPLLRCVHAPSARGGRRWDQGGGVPGGHGTRAVGGPAGRQWPCQASVLLSRVRGFSSNRLSLCSAMIAFDDLPNRPKGPLI
jgi:hypothetical protein